MSGINDESFKENLDIISNNKISKTKSYNLKTLTFDQIVPKNFDIDYISIDIEGSEMNLLNSINFDNYNIKVISVENNFPEKQNFNNFLSYLNKDLHHNVL